MGLEPLSAHDDFWLYDSQINPVNEPAFMVFEKLDVKPELFMENVIKKIGRGHRCSVKLVKIFGKYFFEKLTDEEYLKWKRTHTGVKYDIKTDAEMIAFCKELKKLDGKAKGENTIYSYYFPSINNGTESALMAMGHHSRQDGQSIFQSFYQFSDNPDT